MSEDIKKIEVKSRICLRIWSELNRDGGKKGKFFDLSFQSITLFAEKMAEVKGCPEDFLERIKNAAEKALNKKKEP